MKEYFSPIPNSAIDARQAVRVGLLQAPPELIVDVVPNPTAADMLPSSLKYLASADFLVSHTLMSVPENTAKFRGLTPYSSGRAVILGFGAIPYDTAMGSVLTGKGSWLAGDQVRRAHGGDIGGEHRGLLTLEGAVDDTRVSNDLLRYGFRSALHTGHVVFDKEKLHNWLFAKWLGTNHTYIIERSFGDLAKENADAAYLFRICATTERLGNILFGDIYNRQRRKTEVVRGARVMLAESTLEHSGVARALTTIGEHKDEAIRTLSHLSRGEKITKNERDAYLHLLAAMFARNANAVARVSKTMKDSHLNAWNISEEKDIDYGLVTQDYDIAVVDDDISMHQNRVWYADRAERTIYLYFRFITEYFLQTPDNLFNFERDRFLSKEVTILGGLMKQYWLQTIREFK